MAQNSTREPAQEESASLENRVVPDGIVAHRKALRALGGFVALGVAMSVLIVGLGFLVLPGAVTGVLGFVLIVIALPTLPLFGVPAAGGFLIYAGGFITSAALWWIAGHYASLRASRRVIASWPEWRGEFRPLAIGVVLGSLISLALAAVVLGVL